ncbi:hypothetical protein E8E13_004611 [Curvularia kusanoi]|uniref:Uncharacterized protein n=1 Tax=Curvularia kusanoi TaxID=90978 RepID=A0A9P4T8G8_CURKU|nr:hypothetical protein E8E13_004611 [Curvularia kusanoi]
MKAEHAANSYVQPDVPWGFVVYRAVYGKECNEPWERMLDALWPHPSHWPKEPWELDRSFQLTVMEDEKRLSGADSHTIRKEFREWVAHDLPPRVQYPKQEGGVDSIKARIRRTMVHDVHESEPGNIYHPWYSAPARWSFCLFVDDTCLRSLNHKSDEDAIIGAVVRIVNLRYNKGRCENIAEGWEDGETDDLLENVGWMYMPARRHEDCYEMLAEDPAIWDGEPWYMRPAKDGNPDACGLLYSGFSSFCPGSDGGQHGST